MSAAELLSTSRVGLILRYLKHRWLRDTADLLVDTVEEGRLHVDDLDLDRDMIELRRVSGVDVLVDLARTILQARAPLPSPEALEPELDEPGADAFLKLAAVNLAFRLRTDDLLSDLLAFTAEGPQPRPDPAVIGALLIRTRSVARATELIAASPLAGAERDAALNALVASEVPGLDGGRLHVEGSQEALDQALRRALRPAATLAWTRTLDRPGSRRFLAHRPRGGWLTLLEEGEAPPRELADQLARAGGARRVVWTRFCEDEHDLLILEGTRTVLDRVGLASRLGREPARNDVLGELLAVGILDLDPGHPRRQPELSFARAEEADWTKAGIRAWAFAP